MQTNRQSNEIIDKSQNLDKTLIFGGFFMLSAGFFISKLIEIYREAAREEGRA